MAGAHHPIRRSSEWQRPRAARWISWEVVRHPTRRRKLPKQATSAISRLRRSSSCCWFSLNGGVPRRQFNHGTQVGGIFHDGGGQIRTEQKAKAPHGGLWSNSGCLMQARLPSISRLSCQQMEVNMNISVGEPKLRYECRPFYAAI